MIRRLPALYSGLLLVAALCALSGCASPGKGPGKATEAGATAKHPGQVQAAPWWQALADPLLSRLIADGVAGDARLRERQAELQAAQERSLHWQVRLGLWVARKLDAQPSSPDELALRLDEARQRKAARIAEAYVRVRRQQALLALREQLQRQFADDADIARWRHEAGLVSAVDGGLAHVLLGLDSAALERTRARLDAETAQLAQLAGLTPGELRDRLAEHPGMPRFDTGETVAVCAQATPAQVAADDARLHGLQQQAARTIDDARAAYRLGTGDFASVYVASVALLHTREAEVDEQARRALTAIQSRTAEGLRAARAAFGQQPRASAAGSVHPAAPELANCGDD